MTSGAFRAAGSIVGLIGSLIWIYGYFVHGHPSFVDWQSRTPWWIADFMPNAESEIGMGVMLASVVPSLLGLMRRSD
jgi:hypothetical protein